MKAHFPSPGLGLLLAGFLFGLPVSSDLGAQTEEEERDVDELLEEWMNLEDPDDDLADLDALLAPIPIWDTEARIAAGAGYRDNVMHSAVDEKGGTFLLGGVEVMTSRIPPSGVTWVFGFDFEVMHYPGKSDFRDETLASVFVHFRAPVLEDSQISVPVVLIYFDQVVDPSTLEAIHDPMPIRLRGVTVNPAFRTYWRSHFFADTSFWGGRQELVDPWSDYWEYGPRQSIGYRFDGGEIDLGVAYQWRDFDDRLARTRGGEERVGTDVGLEILRLEKSTRYTWGDTWRWRARNRVFYDFFRDDSTGYFDYDRFGVSQNLSVKRDRWNVEGRVRYTELKYKVQQVAGGQSRRRSTWGADLEVRWRFARSFDIFGRYDWQDVNTNEPGSDYTVNTWTAGLGWNF